MDEKRAQRLLGCPERRATLNAFEVRAGTDNTFYVRGYASVANHKYDVYGGPEKGGWTEEVDSGAFNTTLAAKPDVSFLINHDGMPLARTKSGTLTLCADSTGLCADAEVDRRDPFSQALEVKMERGDLDQMSFGFRVTRQSWNEDYTERTIQEVNLDHGDVSIVNIPANPATSMSIVSARSAVEILGVMEMAELRSELGDITPDQLRSAQLRLGELVEAMHPTTELVPAPTSTVEVEVVPVIRESTRAGLAEAGRVMLRALLDEDATDEQVEALIDAFRTLSQPAPVEVAPVAAERVEEPAVTEPERITLSLSAARVQTEVLSVSEARRLSA